MLRPLKKISYRLPLRLFLGLCLMSIVSASFVGCSSAYQEEERYSVIPSTNNPAVTRHQVQWQPGAKY